MIVNRDQWTDMGTNRAQPGVQPVIVTAFLDVGRSSWSTSPKDTIDFYMASFRHYLRLGNKMVVFLDKTLVPLLGDELDDFRIQLVPIDRDWLRANTLTWQQQELATEVMRGDLYQTLLHDRIRAGYPENVWPEYNLVNHCKIDFIHYAITRGYVAPRVPVVWSDFGYHFSVYGRVGPFPRDTIRMPSDTNRLAFCLCSLPTAEDADIGRTLVEARPTFTGGFFGGSQGLLLELHALYHECLDEFYAAGVADDDQHMYLRCWLRRPELFQLYVKAPYHAWPQALSYFV